MGNKQKRTKEGSDSEYLIDKTAALEEALIKMAALEEALKEERTATIEAKLSHLMKEEQTAKEVEELKVQLEGYES